MCCRKLLDVRVCRSEALVEKGCACVLISLISRPVGYLRIQPKTIACFGASVFALQVSFHRKKRVTCSACSGLDSEREHTVPSLP